MYTPFAHIVGPSQQLIRGGSRARPDRVSSLSAPVSTGRSLVNLRDNHFFS